MVFEEARKGPRIKIVGGSYVGCRGWMDLLKGSTQQKHHVILEEKEPLIVGGEKSKCLSKLSIRELHQDEETGAKTLEEAVIYQKQDIDDLMERLVMELAKCELDADNNDKEITRLMLLKWKGATAALNSMGDHTKYRKVHFFGSTHK